MNNLTSFEKLVINNIIYRIEDFDNIELNEFVQEISDEYCVYYDDATDMLTKYHMDIISYYDELSEILSLDYSVKIDNVCNLVNNAMYCVAYKLICMISVDLDIEDIENNNQEDIIIYLNNIKEIH